MSYRIAAAFCALLALSQDNFTALVINFRKQRLNFKVQKKDMQKIFASVLADLFRIHI